MQQQYNQYPAINSNRIIYFNLFFFFCVCLRIVTQPFLEKTHS